MKAGQDETKHNGFQFHVSAHTADASPPGQLESNRVYQFIHVQILKIQHNLRVLMGIPRQGEMHHVSIRLLR